MSTPFKLLATTWAAVSLAGPASAIDTVWFGGSGNWGVGSNWSAGQPGAADVAVINAGAVTLGFDTTVLGLNQGGGTLGGTGVLTLTGPSIWSAGTHTGAGTTRFDNTLAISGNNGKGIGGTRVINLGGTTTWGGNTANLGNSIFFNQGTINNSGTFNDTNAFSTLMDTLGVTSFNNTGTYNKQGGATTTIEVAFNNTGAVNVDAGRLHLHRGTSSGSFALAGGATLGFTFGTHTLNNATVSGAGTLQVGGGTVLFNNGTYSAPLLVSGGNLAGSAATFTGPASWTGGNITGAGTTRFDNTLAITGNTGKGLSGTRVVDLAGTTTWGGNTANLGNSIFFNQGTINNSGTFNDTNAFSTLMDTLGVTSFNNTGTYNKQGGATTTIEVAFNNTGAVNVDAGRLHLHRGTSSGSFALAGGATLGFTFGTHTLNNATVSGAGTLQVGGGTVLFNNGSYGAPLLLSSGNLAGSAATFTGPATWTGGNITGAGTTRFDNTLAITGNTGKGLSGTRVIDLAGTTTWGGNTGNLGNSIFFNQGTINNSGTFNDTNSFNTLMDTLGATAFNNTGTYNKQGNSTTTIEVVLNNTSAINVDAGTLNVSSSFDNHGTISVAARATFGATNLFRDLQNHGVLQGHGTYDPAAGRTLLNAGQVSPGMSTGELTVAGNYTQTAAGVLNIELAGLADFDLLSVTDDVRLDGNIRVWNAGYVPVLGDTFVVMTFDQRLANSTFDDIITQGYAAGVVFEAIYNLHDVTLRVTEVAVAVPEPESWAMLLAGIGLMGLVARRRTARR